MKNVFASKNIDDELRENLFKAYARSVALYRSATWTVGKS